jgi:hypothetical protein
MEYLHWKEEKITDDSAESISRRQRRREYRMLALAVPCSFPK